MGDESSGDLLSKYFLQMGMGRTEIVMFGCGRRLLEESIRFAMRQWEVVEFLMADNACFRRAIQTSPLPIRLGAQFSGLSCNPARRPQPIAVGAGLSMASGDNGLIDVGIKKDAVLDIEVEISLGGTGG